MSEENSPPLLTIAPEPRSWRSLLRQNTSSEARGFREQLALPTDRPIVMTGHQAQFWHPGILAKYLAADAFAQSLEGPSASSESSLPALAFIVVDQDRPDSTVVRYPVVEELGNLGVREWTLAEGQPVEAPRAGGAPEFVQRGLDLIAGAMRAHASDAPFARAIAGAAGDLFGPLLSGHGHRARTLLATELHRADLFAQLVERMGREPERCVRAYNAAAAAHPGAGIRPLVADEVQDRWELPLWRLPPGAPRSHVYAEDLPTIPREQLAPKALLMTGLLRMAGCDLFIHGLGGGGADSHTGYDAATDQWLRSWLGDVQLAPLTVVTATCRLPLQGASLSQKEIEHAVWRAHHARHIPGELGLRSLEEQRRALVAQIAVAAPLVRRRLFHDLHRELDAFREEHSTELAELEREAAAARARAGDAAIAQDRTWAFPLYPPETLQRLRDQIAEAFAP